MSNVYFPTDHTAEQWRALARDCERSADESFDRSDTDGYLSQWASTCTARLYRLCADVADNGNVWTFDALADADGNIIEGARYVQTRYGWSWVYDGPDGTVWFRPSQAQNEERRQAADLRRGYQIVDVTLPAVVIMRGESMMSLRPVVIPKKSDHKSAHAD